MKKIFLFLIIGTLITGFASAFIFWINIDSVENNINHVIINFADDTNIMVQKSFEYYSNGNSKNPDPVKSIVISNVEENTQVCVIRDHKQKCI